MRDDNGSRWMTVERLAAMLPMLPEGSELMVNRVGNLNVYEPGEHGKWLGILDLGFETWEPFGPQEHEDPPEVVEKALGRELRNLPTLPAQGARVPYDAFTATTLTVSQDPAGKMTGMSLALVFSHSRCRIAELNFAFEPVEHDTFQQDILDSLQRWIIDKQETPAVEMAVRELVELGSLKVGRDRLQRFADAAMTKLR